MISEFARRIDFNYEVLIYILFAIKRKRYIFPDEVLQDAKNKFVELLGDKLFGLLDLEDQEQKDTVTKFLAQGMVLVNFSHMKQQTLAPDAMEVLNNVKAEIIKKIDVLNET